jgi:hypothetical protein
LKEIDGKLTARTEQSLANHADALVAERAAFLSRSVADGNAWLSDIEAERDSRKKGDIETLRKLVPCWKTVTDTQRTSLRLDQPDKRATCILNLAILRDDPTILAD